MITRTNLNDERITGRLGNQLWSIASTIGIANKHKVPYYFPDWHFQRYFDHPLPYERHLETSKLRTYTETTPYYEDINLDLNYDWDLKGYFQSYKYFDNCKDEIKYYFYSHLYDWKEEVKYNTCAVHIRRGDYISLQDIHPLMDLDYYRDAMKLFPSDTLFTIFSDDLKWVNEHFKGNNVYVLDGSHEPALDFLSMTYRFRHIITANSSYSWWAAYLKPFEDKIIVAPKTWVRTEKLDDRVPAEWTRI